MAIATGVFVDADHVPEYADWLLTGWRRFMLVPFHAWEFMLVALGVMAFVWHHPLFTAAVLGYAGHLTCDNLANRTHPLAYFMTYRLIRRFRHGRLVRPPEAVEPEQDVPAWASIEPWLWRIVRRFRRGRTEVYSERQETSSPGD